MQKKEGDTRMANKGVIKPVSFKHEEIYLLEALQEKYKPLSFSNYVKRLIVQDLAGTNTKALSEQQEQQQESATNYNINEERDDLDF